jgi:hypothetical protein
MKEIGLWGGQGTNPPPGRKKVALSLIVLCLCLIVGRCSRPLQPTLGGVFLNEPQMSGQVTFNLYPSPRGKSYDLPESESRLLLG